MKHILENMRQRAQEQYARYRRAKEEAETYFNRSRGGMTSEEELEYQRLINTANAQLSLYNEICTQYAHRKADSRSSAPDNSLNPADFDVFGFGIN